MVSRSEVPRPVGKRGTPSPVPSSGASALMVRLLGVRGRPARSRRGEPAAYLLAVLVEAGRRQHIAGGGGGERHGVADRRNRRRSLAARDHRNEARARGAKPRL